MDLPALRTAINGFAQPDRARGSTCFAQGRVRGVRALSDPVDAGATGFEADVQGAQSYTVSWEYVPNGRWSAWCTCPVEIDCEHCYAAALAFLKRASRTVEFTIVDPSSSRPGVPANVVAAGTSGEVARLVALLEQGHNRRLTKAEHVFVRQLEQLWERHRFSGTIYPQELAALGLGDQTSGFYHDYNPAFRDWWSQPLDSPLELWQYLALFAERNHRPLPHLMLPLTDTSQARARVETVERGHQVKHWEQLFRDHPVGAATPLARAGTLPEIRLRLAKPKLIWEYKPEPAVPWRAAKGGLVKQWFETAAECPAGVSPATLALLQEAQLRRLRARPGHFVWGSPNEPQTLKIDDESTGDLIHWLLTSEHLSNLFVNTDGETFDPVPVALVWTAQPSAARPDDVELGVTFPDGAPLPTDVMQLPGRSPFGLHGRTILQFPPSLPGALAGSSCTVPREALGTVAAARHLRRAGVVMAGGLELPEVELVTLHPRFVCRLADDPGTAGLAPLSGLQVDLRARSADGVVAKRWNGQAWTTLPGQGLAALPRREDKVWDLDLSPAEGAIPFLAELRVTWTDATRGWTRAVTKNFPDEFAAWAANVRAAGIEIECDPSLAGLARPPDRARLELQIDAAEDGGSGIDWFDLQLGVRAEDATLSDAEIALLLKARGRFVLLKGKGWRRLELDLDAEQTTRLGELGLDPASLDGASERQRFHALQLADERIAGLLPEQHAEQVRARAACLRAIAPPPVPAALTAELRPYQQEGFHFLAHLASNALGGVLADDMGLGKTVQALAWLLWLRDARSVMGDVRNGMRTAGGGAANGVGAPSLERSATGPAARHSLPAFRALVVCPKSVMTNWELETRRFAPSLTVAVFRARDSAPPETDLVIVNYAQLRLASDVLGAITWDAVILDEGQNIKNPQSQTAQVARDLRAPHRLVLTGTPIENRVLDLWSLFAFAMPGLLGGQTAFKRTFNDKTDPLARARLARRVRHFMLRRTKAQVAADLPPRSEEDMVVELEPGQRRLYDAELKRTRQMLLGVQSAREFDAQRFNILQSLLRLRQICCDPRLLGAGGDGTDSAKVTALFDQLEPILAEGHKVLVFSQFVSLLEILQQELTTREIRFLTITGQTENRQKLVDEFQTSTEVRVFLLSLKAAGAGLNLTAASYVVLFDPWWNPAVEAQAIDRTHRIGQTNPVIAYRLIAKDTIEEKIRRLQQEKAALARAIVQEESLASVMNLDDLRFVLG